MLNFTQMDNEDDIKKYVLDTYRPLTSPDGKGNWTNMQPFSVLFSPYVDGERGVWVETTLSHFSFKAIATKIVKKIAKNIKKLAVAAVDLLKPLLYILRPWSPPPLKGIGNSRDRMVCFRNLTQASDFPPSLSTSSIRV